MEPVSAVPGALHQPSEYKKHGFSFTFHLPNLNTNFPSGQCSPRTIHGRYFWKRRLSLAGHSTSHFTGPQNTLASPSTSRHCLAHTFHSSHAKYLHFLNYIRRFLTLSMLFSLPGMFFPVIALCLNPLQPQDLVKHHLLQEVFPAVSKQRWESDGAVSTVGGCIICHTILLHKPGSRQQSY